MTTARVTLFLLMFSLLQTGFIQDCLANSARTHPGFIEAINAVKSGEFERAKKLFEKAKNDNFHSPKLYYNLGVVNYKLRLYHQARLAFMPIIQDKTLKDLVLYNLALIEIKLENDKKALGWLNQITRQAINRSTPPSLYKMALSLSNKIEHAQLTNTSISSFDSSSSSDDANIDVNYQTPDEIFPTLAFYKNRKFITHLKTEFGYNDNIAQYQYIQKLNNDTSGDNFLLLQLNTQSNISKNISIMASTYYMAYQRKTYFNSVNLLANANYHNAYNQWQYSLGSSYMLYTLNDIENQEMLRIELSLIRNINRSITYQSTLLNDTIRILNKSYDHLGGKRYNWKHRFDIAGKRNDYTVGYQFEKNFRNDFSSNDGLSFTSFSPTVHRIEISAAPAINSSFKFKTFAGLDYLYHTKNNIISDSNFTLRKDIKYQIGFSVFHQLKKHIDLSGIYQYSRNQSTIRAYNFDNSLYQFGVSWKY